MKNIDNMRVEKRDLPRVKQGEMARSARMKGSRLIDLIIGDRGFMGKHDWKGHEPMAEPPRRYGFDYEMDMVRSVPGGFIVDIRAPGGRMVAEGMDVRLWKRRRIFDDGREIAISVSFRCPGSLMPRKTLVTSVTPPMRMQSHEDVDEAIRLLARGDRNERYCASASLVHAVKMGMDLRREIGNIIQVLRDGLPEMRTNAAYMLIEMAAAGNDIADAVPRLEAGLSGQDLPMRTNAAWALAMHHRNRGDEEGFSRVLERTDRKTRKAIEGNIDHLLDIRRKHPYR